ncbi:c-type cytochrome [Acidovorax sp. NCPPB 3859]|uniref:di-heme oxidoreductase family protein n=1 Tax=Paracidovorax avenae TaxID=80867 RepID=UPI000D21FF28|nr:MULTISPECIES: di-heme oxidoredictase family protein [Comamonadaceae]AVT14668.1 thiol oxidoreductase [Paracidovorax avenae]MDA8450565.1 c-type cytochrome [Acidovorax sp. GBBC 3297]MDA8460068.1 c-type cytochrome [Acidovorax sp. GBBC 3333]MDA8465104.1 c-type cytochrome [Acidovorax sp. GBBC 3332]MDA8470080.1 c-type cytochrome [Acidovorax sp. GBBC 3299]
MTPPQTAPGRQRALWPAVTLAGSGLAAAGALLLAGGAAAGDPPDPLGEKTGGDTTVYATGRNAFSFPAANLEDAERTRFVIGNSFFKRNWVEAGASTKARDGLGPHFIARSCGGCHVQDGRGEPPEIFNRLGETRDPIVSLLIRLSIPGTDPHGGPNPEPVYGDQLNTAAVQGVKPEGTVTLRYETVKGSFADGTPYTLLKPHYGVRDLGYGPLHAGTMLSPRIAPQVIGVGLLEAIGEADILANAADQAAAPGPVKGRPNHVWDAPSGRKMLGRFGWKANVATLAHQTGGAFVGDMGITSRHFPSEHCTTTQVDCGAAPSGRSAGARGQAGVEIDDKTFDDVVFYQATLAPPARRDVNDATVLRGQALFAQAQCAACHRPSYVTKEGPFPRLTSKALSGQRIWPYTDLLLHDMGEGLADGRPDFLASGRQWRTPPLWGIGLIKDVNGHTRLLHDGRARGVLEAILWHGGEAEEAKQNVLKMDKAERDALVRFVESL